MKQIKSETSNLSRLEWVDYARAIAIILIIIGHANAPTEITKFLYSFHVQAFFVISGFFFNCDMSFGAFVKKKVKRLVIPYFIAQIGLNIVAHLVFGANIPLHDIFHEVIYSGGVGGHWFVTPLWFLIALFFGQILAFVFFHATNRRSNTFRMLIALCIVMIYFVCYKSNSIIYIRLPFMLDLLPVILLFIVFGKVYFDTITKITITPVLLLIVVVLTVTSITCSEPVNTAIRLFGNPINYMSSSFGGSICIFFIARLFESQSLHVLQYIGKHSFLFCIMHPVGFALAGSLYNIFFPSIYNSSLIWIANALISLAFCLLISLIWDHSKAIVSKL